FPKNKAEDGSNLKRAGCDSAESDTHARAFDRSAFLSEVDVLWSTEEGAGREAGCDRGRAAGSPAGADQGVREGDRNRSGLAQSSRGHLPGAGTGPEESSERADQPRRSSAAAVAWAGSQSARTDDRGNRSRETGTGGND